ncbi:MAG: hypothetical protein GWN62_16980 [Aliifodinibius sp.]|nr:hypothetical protein [Fodinibius sp.]
MKHDIIIRRPINEGSEFIKKIMSLSARYGYIHIGERTDAKNGFVYNTFELDRSKTES